MGTPLSLGLGDRQALKNVGRRAITFRLGSDPTGELGRLGDRYSSFTTSWTAAPGAAFSPKAGVWLKTT